MGLGFGQRQTSSYHPTTAGAIVIIANNGIGHGIEGEGGRVGRVAPVGGGTRMARMAARFSPGRIGPLMQAPSAPGSARHLGDG